MGGGKGGVAVATSNHFYMERRGEGEWEGEEGIEHL